MRPARQTPFQLQTPGERSGGPKAISYQPAQLNQWGLAGVTRWIAGGAGCLGPYHQRWLLLNRLSEGSRSAESAFEFLR